MIFMDNDNLMKGLALVYPVLVNLFIYDTRLVLVKFCQGCNEENVLRIILQIFLFPISFQLNCCGYEFRVQPLYKL